jgi:broad specificity phosphatase PhoE
VTTVYLARHGETEWSRIGRRQGRLDAPLTVEGLAEVDRVAAMLASLPIDALFSSPLARASSTAAIYGEALGLSVVLLDDLQEIDHGEMSGLTRAEIDAAYPGEFERRSTNHYSWRFPGGESYEDADGRAFRAIDAILATSTSPLVVSHEMIGRMLLRNLLELTPAEALEFRHPHGAIYAVDPESSTMTVLTPD